MTKSAMTKPEAPTPGSRLGLIVGMIILLCPLGIYILFLCPTVFVGDAGDFLTAAFTLGVPHPPGYPVYTLLGHLFMNLPIPGGVSSPAFRMNLMSALSAWAACVFLFLFLRRALKTEWAAIVGALALAFSAQFWMHAEIAEVYSMQILFLTLIFYIATLYVQEKKIGWAYLMAFFMGLALSHQYAIMLYYPGVLIYVAVNGGFKIKWTAFTIAFFIALLGLVPYIYLPIVKYKTPVGEVVFVANEQEASLVPIEKVASTDSPLAYFWDYFSRRAYTKARAYTNTSEVLPERTTTPMVFKKFVETMVVDFNIPLIVVSGFGWLAAIISVFRRRTREDDDKSGIPRAAMVPAVLGNVLYFLVVHFYPSGDILAAPLENLEVVVPPLLIPLMAGLAMIIAFGFDFVQRGITGYIASQGVSDVPSSQKYRVFTALLMIAAMALIYVNGKNNKEICDKSWAVISYNYAKNVLDSCDRDAILLTTGDETFIFWYLQNCEPSDDPSDPRPGYRKDVWATNWIHNLPSLEILAKGESMAMALIMERFIMSSTYYTNFLDSLNRSDIHLILPHYGARPINTTFVTDTFAESYLIWSTDCVLNGLTYLFRIPGDIPDVGLPEVSVQPDLSAITVGVAPMSVIDYFDARPFAEYDWVGLPRFEGLEEDFSNIRTAEYIGVQLDPQEVEVLGRYQDALYRFGIQSLLHETDESRELAVEYLFRCVSLNPAGWFGWKELGDAYFATQRLDASGEAYATLIDLAKFHNDIDPNLVAVAHAQLGHIALIRSSNSNLTPEERAALKQTSEQEAQLALFLNPDDNVAKAVLVELERQALEEQAEEEEPAPPESTDDAAGEDTDQSDDDLLEELG